MINQLNSRLDFLASALQLRAHRQQVIASNLANADTTGYVARDFDFATALKNATGVESGQDAVMPRASTSLAGQDGRHLHTVSSSQGVLERTRLDYNVQTQPSMDSNSVDMDQQRANFVDNAIQYESTLRFINSHVKTMLSAIQGQ